MRLATFGEQKLPNSSIRVMAKALGEWGYDVYTALAMADLPPALIEDPEIEITGSQELSFQRIFSQLTQTEPDRWVELGLRYRLLSHGPDYLGLMMQTSPTVEQAIQCALQVSELNFSLAEPFGVSEGGRLVGLRSLLSEVPLDLQRFTALRDVGMVVSLFNDLCRKPFPFDRVVVPLNSEDATRLELCLPNVSIVCDSECVAFHWSVRLDQRRPSQSDPILHEVYRRKCNLAVANVRQAGDLIARLVRLVSMANGQLCVDDAARRLGLSVRTLQRRLELKGVTYRDVVRLGRHRAACQLLAQTRAPIGRIALDVGYETLSSFNHAFRQQSGMTPSTYRRSAVVAYPA